MSADNAYKLVARYRKARRIADKIHGIDASLEDLRDADLATRALAAQLAGTHIPSECTWALVVELITERRNACKTTLTTTSLPRMVTS